MKTTQLITKGVTLRLLSIVLTISMFFCTGSMFAVASTAGPDSADNGTMLYYTNTGGAFNIKGYYPGNKDNGGTALQTSYGDSYSAYLRIGASSAPGVNYSTDTHLSGLANGVPKNIAIGATSINLTQTLSFTDDGDFVKVAYTVQNPSATPVVISLGAGSDIQIGSNDGAPIYYTDTGIQMEDDNIRNVTTSYGAQFNVVMKGDNPDVTPVDNIWFGHYSYYSSYMFENLAPSNQQGSYETLPDGTLKLKNTDSGLAFSWENREIPAGESKTFSVLFGIKEADPTRVNNISIVLPDGKNKLELGDTITVNGRVTDIPSRTNTLYYQYYNGNTPIGQPVAMGSVTADGTQKSITVPLTLQEKAKHIRFYVANDSEITLCHKKYSISDLGIDTDKEDPTLPDVGATLPEGTTLLNDAEQAKVDTGAVAKLVLKIAPSTNVEDEGLVQGALGGREFGMYVDLKLQVELDDGTPARSITDTGSTKLKVVITIPSEFRDPSHIFSVIRVHTDGSGVKHTAVLPDLDTNPDTITIETNQFSTYAIAYKVRSAPVVDDDSDDGSQEFWTATFNTLNRAEKNSTTEVDAKFYEYVPLDVYNYLRESGKTLVIKWAGGTPITLVGSKLPAPEIGRVYYPLKTLAPTVAITTPAIPNPETGGIR